MKTKFSPCKNRQYYKVSSPVDVEIRNIATHAMSMSYELELLDTNRNDVLEIVFTEANHHTAKVQIFNSSQKVCSCEQYYAKECGFCKHLAIIDFFQHSFFIEEEQLDFSDTLKSKIRKLKVSSDKKYLVYDSLETSTIEIGNGKEEVKSVSLLTKEKHHVLQPSLENMIQIPFPYELIQGISLYEYQHDILQKMLTAKRAVCSMEMGAGKTFTSIAGLKYLETDNVLICCPKSIINQWISEIQKVLRISPIILSSGNIRSFALQNSGIGICTYQTLARNIEQLSQKRYKVVIADEIQFIRNDESKTWAAFKKIESEYFWGLSGTVIENRLDDLYNIMNVVAPYYLGPKWKFDSKFKKIRSIHRAKVLYDNQNINTPILRKLISTTVFSYNGLKLEEPVHIVHSVSMSKEAQTRHDNHIDAANTLIAKSLNEPLSFAEKAILNSHLLRARQYCNTIELISKEKEGSEKLHKALDIIHETCVRNKNKMVVYSEWTSMLDILQRELLNKVKNVRLDGQMSIKQRNASIKSFVEDEDCLVFFASDAGSIGLDSLQLVCNNMMHIELPWNPAKIDQRIGRLRRLKQKSQVNVHYLVTKNSIESKIQTLLGQKRKVRMDSLYGNKVEEEINPKELLNHGN